MLFSVSVRSYYISAVKGICEVCRHCHSEIFLYTAGKVQMQGLLLVSQMPISDVAVDLTYCAWRNRPLLGLNYSN